MKTPMSQMQDHFKKFNELVSPLFNKLELNKKDSSYNAYNNDGEGGYSKAVESDFIRIYKPSSECKSLKTSFAFAFNNYKNNPEDTIITVSIKKDKIFEVVSLDFPKFKDNFKTYLKMLEVLSSTKKMSGESVIQTLKAVFPVSSEYSEPNYYSILASLQENSSEKIKEMSQLYVIKNEKEKELVKLRSSIEKKVTQYRKELEKKEGFSKLQEETNAILLNISNIEKNLNIDIESKITSFIKLNSSVGINKFKQNLKAELDKKRKKNEIKFSDEFVNLIYKKLHN